MKLNEAQVTAERELINRAQDGDEAAMAQLITAYETTIAKAARKDFRRDADDARQEATLAFIEAVLSHDTERYATLRQRAPQAVAAVRDFGSAFTVPDAMLYRYRAIMKHVGEDYDAARALAPSWKTPMDPATFAAIHLAVSETDSLGAAAADGEGYEAAASSIWREPSSPFSHFEDEAAIASAMPFLTDTQRDVVTLAFGLGGGADAEGLSDAAIASELGLSRSAVQRHRSAALAVLAAHLAL